MGGPALQAHMYPSIYALMLDLGDIKVQISTMAIGWKSVSWNWRGSCDKALPQGFH